MNITPMSLWIMILMTTVFMGIVNQLRKLVIPSGVIKTGELEPPRTKWRCIAGKIIELNSGCSIAEGSEIFNKVIVILNRI